MRAAGEQADAGGAGGVPALPRAGAGPARRRPRVLALGQFGWDVVCSSLGVRPRPRFAHGAEAALPDDRSLLGSYHVSQQNTFTGKLTEAMLDAVLHRSRELAWVARDLVATAGSGLSG